MKQAINRGFLWAIGIMMLVGCAASPSVDPRQMERAEAAKNLAEAYMGKGDYSSALKELLRAEQLNPNDHFLQYDLGMAYFFKEKFDLAIDHFKKALSIRPNFTPAKNFLGTAYMAQKDWDAAIRVFNEVKEDLLYGTPHYPLINLGWIYLQKREYKTAEENFQAALKMEPESISAMHGLGQTYLKEGKGPEAADILEKALKAAASLTPAKQAEIYMLLGEAYAISRQIPKARNAYRQVMELVPDSPLATEAKDRYEMLKYAAG